MVGGRKEAVGGRDRNGDDAQVARAEGSARVDPMLQFLIRIGAAGQAPATLVVDLVGGLAQQQTLRRSAPIDAPAAPFARDPFVILLRVVAEQTQFEATLPCRCAVAGACIATGFREERQDACAKCLRRAHGGLCPYQ